MEQATIAGGNTPDVAERRLPRRRRRRRRSRAGLRLVLRHADVGSADRVARVREPGRDERVESDERVVGQHRRVVGWLGDRRSRRQLLLQLPARDDAARPRRARRVSRHRSMDHRVPRHQARRRARAELRHEPARRRVARGHRLRRVAARSVRALRRVERVDRREHLDDDAAHARVDARLHSRGVADARSHRADGRSIARLDRVVLRLPPDVLAGARRISSRPIRSRRRRSPCCATARSPR